MNSYNRNSRSGGGSYRGRDSRRSDSRRREMHKAVCDNCGNDCEVPFKPSGDKPIYCSNCFEQKGGRSSNRSGRRSSGGSGFEARDNTNKQLLEQVNALNTKLDRILKVIEPSIEKKEVKKEVKEEPKEEKKKLKKAIIKATSKDEKVEVKKESKKEAEKSTPKD